MNWIETKEHRPRAGDTVIVLVDLGKGLELRFATYDFYGRDGRYKPLWAIKSQTERGGDPGGFFPLEVVAQWLPVGML